MRSLGKQSGCLVLAWCLLGACSVLARCLLGACSVPAWCLLGACLVLAWCLLGACSVLEPELAVEFGRIFEDPMNYIV